MSFSKYLFTFILSVILSIPDRAQNLWITSMPKHYHPSFAGNSDALRFSSNNTIEYGKFKNETSSNVLNQNYISMDQFVPKLHSGVGVGFRYSFMNGPRRKMPLSHAHYFEQNLAIAPKFSFKGKYTFSPSLQLINYFTNHHYKTLDFPDMGIQRNFVMKYARMQLKAGLLFNSEYFFIGGTFIIMDRLTNLFDYGSKIKCNMVTAFTFKQSKESDFSFTPVVLFETFYDYSNFNDKSNWNVQAFYPSHANINDKHYLNLYLTARFKKLIAGLDMNKNAMIGYDGEQFRVMLVQQYGTNKNAVNYGDDTLSSYTAQISMRFLFKSLSSSI